MTTFKAKFSRRSEALLVLLFALATVCVVWRERGRARLPAYAEEVHIVETPPTRTISNRAPVIYANNLPQRERNLEAAGDFLAQAGFALKIRHQEAALKALAQASAALAGAMSNEQPHDAERTEQLLLAQNAIETVRQNLQRGALNEAQRHLIALEEQLNRLP